LQMYFTPPPDDAESDLGAPLALVMRPILEEEMRGVRIWVSVPLCLGGRVLEWMW
jgi:hypothetical protein